MTTTNKDIRVSLGQGGGHSHASADGALPQATRVRWSGGALLRFAAAASLAIGCAGELEGKPEDYVAAYYGTGGSSSNSGGSNGIAGTMSTGGGGTTSTAGSGGDSGGGMLPDDLPCVAMVFQSHLCLACHDPNLKQGGLDLTGTRLGARLTMTKSANDVASCENGKLLIDPANPNDSIMLKKVTGRQSCGDTMPLGGKGLTGNDRTCIEMWVNSFAASANQISFDEEGRGNAGNDY